MQRPHRNICGGSCIDALHVEKRCNIGGHLNRLVAPKSSTFFRRYFRLSKWVVRAVSSFLADDCHPIQVMTRGTIELVPMNSLYNYTSASGNYF